MQAFSFSMGKRGVTWLLVFLFFLFNILLTVTLPVDLVLDLRFLYGPEVVFQCLQQMGEEGRSAYIRGIMFLDIPYVVVYALLFARWMKWAWHTKSYFRLVLLVAAMDTLENLLMIYLSFSFPEVDPILAYTASLFTSAKWILVFFLLLMLFWGCYRKVFSTSVD
ncbi:hypothetical protein [Algoriphagus namhaensis]